MDQIIPLPEATPHVWTYPPEPPPGSLAKKMVSAMGDIEAVTKSGKNEKQGYRYVKAADVANEVRSVLVKHGIAFFYSVEAVERWEVPTNSGGKLFFCQLIVQVTFKDSDTGDEMVVQGIGWGADSLEKAPYKAMTGALKYCLRMGLLIPDEEDPENERPEPRPAQPNRPAVNQTPAKGTEAPRPSDRKPDTPPAPAQAPVDPPKTAEAPVAPPSAPQPRSKEETTAHNKIIRELQEAADPERVKEYIIANVGPDYKKAPYEKWEVVLQKMVAAKTAGQLKELVGA